MIGAFKFHSRAINGIDGDVRLTERLYLPRSRLRGFNTYKVGPKDGDDYIGGNYTTAIGFEAQLPNLLPESYRTDFSFFLDGGKLLRIRDLCRWPDRDDYYLVCVSVGGET